MRLIPSPGAPSESLRIIELRLEISELKKQLPRLGTLGKAMLAALETDLAEALREEVPA